MQRVKILERLNAHGVSSFDAGSVRLNAMQWLLVGMSYVNLLTDTLVSLLRPLEHVTHPNNVICNELAIEHTSSPFLRSKGFM